MLSAVIVFSYTVHCCYQSGNQGQMHHYKDGAGWDGMGWDGWDEMGSPEAMGRVKEVVGS